MEINTFEIHGNNIVVNGIQLAWITKSDLDKQEYKHCLNYKERFLQLIKSKQTNTANVSKKAYSKKAKVMISSRNEKELTCTEIVEYLDGELEEQANKFYEMCNDKILYSVYDIKQDLIVMLIDFLKKTKQVIKTTNIRSFYYNLKVNRFETYSKKLNNGESSDYINDIKEDTLDIYHPLVYMDDKLERAENMVILEKLLELIICSAKCRSEKYYVRNIKIFMEHYYDESYTDIGKRYSLSGDRCRVITEHLERIARGHMRYLRCKKEDFTWQ